ncbi:MAG: hypothetical protein JSW21_12505, partial [Gammaproteobacteria bacterium]
MRERNRGAFSGCGRPITSWPDAPFSEEATLQDLHVGPRHALTYGLAASPLAAAGSLAPLVDGTGESPLALD